MITPLNNNISIKIHVQNYTSIVTNNIYCTMNKVYNIYWDRSIPIPFNNNIPNGNLDNSYVYNITDYIKVLVFAFIRFYIEAMSNYYKNLNIIKTYSLTI